MLQGAALKLLIPRDALRIQRSRCLRHRFSSSSCNNCFNVCSNEALSWTESGLHWEQQKCSGCLLCVASCPDDALTAADVNIGELLQQLAESDSPLLACSTKTNGVGHVRLRCLGVLADVELLLVLQLALGKELRMNLSGCSDCENSRIVPPLKKALDQVEKITADLPGSTQPIYSAALLGYQEKTISRRDFFGFLNRRSKQVGVSLVDRLRTDSTVDSYGKKALPLTRRLLLQLAQESAAIKKMIHQHLLPDMHLSENCTGCTACVGICPTGALARAETKGSVPEINKERCTACNLCVEFCRQSAITVTKQT